MAAEGSEPVVIPGENRGLLVLRRKVRMLMTVFKDKRENPENGEKKSNVSLAQI